MAVFITIWDKNYKVKQLLYKILPVLLQRRAAWSYNKVRQKILQSGTIVITKLHKSYYKVEQTIYYKVGQSLLQSLAGITKWGYFPINWPGTTQQGNYWKKASIVR